MDGNKHSVWLVGLEPRRDFGIHYSAPRVWIKNWHTQLTPYSASSFHILCNCASGVGTAVECTRDRLLGGQAQHIKGARVSSVDLILRLRN